MTSVRSSLLSTVFAGLLAFVLGGSLSYFVAARLTVLYAGPSFSELGHAEGHKLSRITQSLYGLELSRLLTQSTPVSLQRSVGCLRHIRAGAPPEVAHAIDLQLATDYSALALLEQQNNDPTAAGSHRQIAASLLQSIGWKDTSARALDNLAGQYMHKGIKP